MHPTELKVAFDRGENITDLLRRETQSEANTEEIIETAYDLQAGSYVAALDDPSFREYKEKYGKAIADVLTSLVDDGGSILEPGVGEGTTLSFVMKHCGSSFGRFHGFDISWSRIAKCREWLLAEAVDDVFVSVASIFNAPYADNSFDIVYTSHTVEPNGGREVPILQELFRVASQYLVLLEPGYELATPEAQQRMTRLGYVRGLKDHAISMGMKVLGHELFGLSSNPLNPTAITIIEKAADKRPAQPRLTCPRYGDPIVEYDGSLYSPGSMRAYPRIHGIPCLRIEDGILASQYEDYSVVTDDGAREL
ncbi:MAG: class I SAM-dependent methyltransferase [Planctomycetota bacterium]|nr:class I SAM-dependent methyltransferase [Planctomycetota bacterium]